MTMARRFILASFIFSSILAAPHQVRSRGLEHEVVVEKRAPSLPFNSIVAFGDDMTDDGSGSYAHGITGDKKTGQGKHMWGANTFTDGLIAVSYLSEDLNIPIKYNYAWGSSGGAQFIGSVCDNKLLNQHKLGGHAKYEGKVVPAAIDQINNYTTSGVFTDNIDQTLHFFWTGNNDMIASLGWDGRFTLCASTLLCGSKQQKFIDKLAGCFKKSLNNLVDAGAQHILVPNVYPRETTPWTTMWITKTLNLLNNFESVIDTFNSQLSTLIDDINNERGTNIMLYDVNSFVKTSLNDPTQVQGAGYTNTCVDGCKIQNPSGTGNWNLYWNHTVVHGKPDLFYWMTEVVPSTTVHEAIAQDMQNFLYSQF